MMLILYNSGAKFTNEANVHVRIVCDMLQTLLNNVSIYTFTEKRAKKKDSSNFVGIKKIFLAGEIYYVGKILSHDSVDT